MTFLLAFTPPSPWGSNSLSPKPQPSSQFTSSNWREGPRPYLQVTAYVLFWPEGWVCLSSASHNSEHEQGTTWTWLIHATRELQTNSHREQGISGNTEQTVYRLQKPGWYSAKWGHSEAATYKEDSRMPHVHPGKRHVWQFLRRPGALPSGWVVWLG